MSTYRFVLVEDSASSAIVVRRRPVRPRRPGRAHVSPDSLAAALRVLRLVMPGAGGFTSPIEGPLAFLIDAVSDPIFIRDAQVRALYANRAARRADARALAERVCRSMTVADDTGELLIEVHTMKEEA